MCVIIPGDFKVVHIKRFFALNVFVLTRFHCTVILCGLSSGVTRVTEKKMKSLISFLCCCYLCFISFVHSMTSLTYTIIHRSEKGFSPLDKYLFSERRDFLKKLLLKMKA